MPTPKTKRTTVPSAVETPRAKSTPKGTYPNPAYGLTLVILLLTAALLIGGMGVFWKDSILRQARKEMDVRYMQLVQELKGQTGAAEEKNIPDSHPLPKLEDGGPLNSDPANTTVEYSNPEKGLASIDLPYNENWGNASLAVAPYDQESNSVSFGPLYTYSAHPTGQPTLGRTMNLYIIEPRSSSASMRAAASGTQEKGSVAPILRVFPNVTYVKYCIANELNAGCYVEVIGQKANYRLSSPLSSNLPDLERIARTIQFAK
jgi:hypothetical protein